MCSTSSDRVERPWPPQRLARTRPPGARPTWIEVDLDAVRANAGLLKARAAPALLMAVVKADAYGHGLVPVARAALDGGASWLGVALVEEGVALRTAGIRAPILVLSEPPPQAVDILLDNTLTPAMYSPSFLTALEAALSRRGGSPVDVHLKLDTGMRRVGVARTDWDDMFRTVARARHVRVQALWSHLAVADQPGHRYTSYQAEQFSRGVELARSHGVRPSLLHLCNSAATLHASDLHYDMVRTGLAIYGLEPAPGLAAGLGLRPALAWYSRLALVKPLAAGDRVGYGLRWSAQEDTLVGTLPVGYADGLRRGSTRSARVALGGRTVTLAGVISMDQSIVDLGSHAAEAEGDDVALIGSSASAQITVEDWARWWGTINYEVVCTIGTRVPRAYVCSTSERTSDHVARSRPTYENELSNCRSTADAS